MRIVVMDGGDDDKRTRACSDQFADQAFAVAVRQAPVDQRQAVVMAAHAVACFCQCGGTVNAPDGWQDLRQDFSQPLPWFVEVFDD